MANETQLEPWLVRTASGRTTVCDQTGHIMATVTETTGSDYLIRAALIASAPTLYASTSVALDAFRAIRTHATGTAADAAGDMIPMLEHAIACADTIGPVTEAALGERRRPTDSRLVVDADDAPTLPESVRAATPEVWQYEVPSAWLGFAGHLAETLAKLQAGWYLIISAGDTNRFVQFAGWDWGIRAEVTSNDWLEGAQRLDDAHVEKLRALGWHAPTGSGKTSTPEDDPNGSPNNFLEWRSELPVEYLAQLAV